MRGLGDVTRCSCHEAVWMWQVWMRCLPETVQSVTLRLGLTLHGYCELWPVVAGPCQSATSAGRLARSKAVSRSTNRHCRLWTSSVYSGCPGGLCQSTLQHDTRHLQRLSLQSTSLHDDVTMWHAEVTTTDCQLTEVRVHPLHLRLFTPNWLRLPCVCKPQSGVCKRRGGSKQQTLWATHRDSHSRGVSRAASFILSTPAAVTQLLCSLQPTDASVIRAKFTVKTLSSDHESLLTSECVNKTLINSSTTTSETRCGVITRGVSETVYYNVRELMHLW